MLPVISATPMLQTNFYPNATFPRRASGRSREISNTQCSSVYRGILYVQKSAVTLASSRVDKQLGIKRRMIFTLQRLISEAQLVEALRYRTEGRGFDSRWSHLNYSLTWSFGRAMTLASAQLLTEMSTWGIFCSTFNVLLPAGQLGTAWED